MVKLKRITEGQLDLFSWKPKETVPTEQPKINTIKEEPKNTNSENDSTYDGREDTDQSKWYTPGFLNRKYKEFNSRFFNNDLPTDLPVRVGASRGGKSAGGCHFVIIPSKSEIKPSKIVVLNKKFANRYVLENVLLHEMCHVYQANFLCNGDLSIWKADSRKGRGSSGHGPLFFKAADLVNNSPNNKEGYKITQYASPDDIESKPMVKADGWFLFSPSSLFSVHAGMISNTSTGKSKVADYMALGSSHFFTYKDGSVKAKIYDLFGRKLENYYIFSPNIKKVFSLISSGDLIYSFGKSWNNGCIREFCYNKDGEKLFRVLVIHYQDTFYTKLVNYFSTSFNIKDLDTIKRNLQYRDYKINQPYSDLILYIQPGILNMDKSLDDAMNVCVNNGVYSIQDWKDLPVMENKSLKLNKKKISESEEDSIDTEFDSLIKDLKNIPNISDIEENGSSISFYVE